MKRMGFMLMALVLVLLAVSCAKAPETTPGTQLPNPVHDSSAQEILEKLGITLHLPPDAQDVHYSILELTGEPSVAQAQFSSSGLACTYRIQPASELKDISGAYFDWKSDKDIEISYCPGEVHYLEGEQGICLWYDVVPGLMYSLYVENGASEEILLNLANQMYVPAKDVP